MNASSENWKHGELLEESFDFKNITWKIPDFLSLPNDVNYKVQSATFSFANATWRLVMYPNDEKIELQDYVSLAIVRLSSQIPEHYISYEICFKTRNGKKFDNYCSSQLYNTDCNEFGAFKFLRKSKFKQMMSTFVKNGILTVLCTMRTKKIAGIDRYSQVATTTSLLGSDDILKSKLLDVHEKKLVCDFKEFFLKKDGCDVFLKVSGVEFPAHKAILSARSSVFTSAFQSDIKGKTSPVIEIEDCDPSTFSDFLCFLYCGDIQNLSSENALGLFTSADKYDMPDLKAKCVEFIKENLSVDTFCDTISLALKHFDTELIELATDFFAENFKKIIVTAKWESFVLKNPIQSNKLMIKALLPDFK